MAIEPPSAGSVIDYPYLWVREHEAGETEGRKSRPVCLVLTVLTLEGEHLVVLLPITSQSPTVAGASVEVPELERRRAGLSDRPAWVITSEFNTDILERSWYYEPGSRRGAFSGPFVKRLLEAVRPAIAKRSARVDRRT
jgi:hypothetical protein